MEEIRKEVVQTLARWRPTYEAFHSHVLRELSEFRHKPQNQDAIYRLYSRADKQKGGECIKSVDSIAKKLAKWRSDGHNCKLHDIHDIVGVTMVTYFNAEIEPLIERLKDCQDFAHFKIGEIRRVNEKGYFAHHIELEGIGANKWSQIKCELQVKTLLSDGWATRTHDMVYKAPHAISRSLDRLVATIGDMIQNIEGQSDGIKEIISGHVELLNSMRHSAINNLVYGLTQNDPSETGKIFANLANLASGNLKAIREARLDGKEITELLNQWRIETDITGHTKSSGRFIVFIALIRPARDLNNIAFDSIDSWIGNAQSNLEKASALGFRSLTDWILNGAEEATKSSAIWLDFVQATDFLPEEDKPARLSSAMLEHAYYRAERFYNQRHEDEAQRTAERAAIMKLLADAPPPASIRKEMVAADTHGAVSVMLAESVEELVEARKIYCKAYEWAKGSPSDIAVFKEFYNLNEQRYKLRLRDFL